jgi:hypothetical protein
MAVVVGTVIVSALLFFVSVFRAAAVFIAVVHAYVNFQSAACYINISLFGLSR